jgi:hypothetical protein
MAKMHVVIDYSPSAYPLARQAVVELLGTAGALIAAITLNPRGEEGLTITVDGERLVHCRGGERLEEGRLAQLLAGKATAGAYDPTGDGDQRTR